MPRFFAIVVVTTIVALGCALSWITAQVWVPRPAPEAELVDRPAESVADAGIAASTASDAAFLADGTKEQTGSGTVEGPREPVFAPSPPRDPAARDLRIAELVRSIESEGGYYGEHVGLGGETPETWKAFAELRDLGTVEELAALVSHPSPAVRAYAFEALVARGAEVYPLLQDRLGDLALVAHMDGCVSSQEKVADLMLGLAWDTLDPAQREALTDRILAEELDLAFRTRLLRSLDAPEARYEAVRRLAARGDAQALVALARYRRTSDVPLIVEAFRSGEGRYAALEAMAAFPQPEYLPVLRDYQTGLAGADHFSNEWRAMYAALAAYESPEVLPLLEKAFDDEPMRTYHLDFLLQALERHRIPLYESLMLRLLLEAKTCPPIVEHLFTNAPERLDAQIPALLEQASMLDQDVLGRLLTRLVQDPEDPARRATLRRFIEKADVHRIDVAVRTIAATHDPEAIPILFRIAEQHSNPYMYLAASRALLLYDQGWIDARLQAMLREREASTAREDPTWWGIEKLRGLLERSPRVWKSTGQG